jgi:hypothetical protein
MVDDLLDNDSCFVLLQGFDDVSAMVFFFLQGVTRCPSWPKGTLASTSFFALNEKM